VLLIAGGLLDPNRQALANAAAGLGVDWVDWRCPHDASPPFHWDLSQVDEQASIFDLPQPWGPSGPMPRGAFIRQDVFAPLSDPRPEVAQRALGWFVAVQGWLLAHPGVRHFNPDMSPHALNKPAALLRARHHGLRIPDTWVSNDTTLLKARLQAPTIAKPVAGGGLCQTLDEALSTVQAAHSAMPALIQPRLTSPEVRVFVVGQAAHAFELRSPSLDYRAEQDAEISPIPLPEPELALLKNLMLDLRMDFGAADFKTDPATGELVFLELNTSPMFARFDQVSEGRLAADLVRQLLSPRLA